jgi:hypothetical protein
MSAILDHIVINTRFEMDKAETIFSDLGFTLTPRGFHTLGSHNHLMMFATDFLELIGIAEADGHMRPELVEGNLGLNGLVFKSDDVDKTYARLESLGMAGDSPKSFSRPVTLSDGSTRDACFRTVTARADSFPAGRLYFCEHQTPDLIWRPEWQSHENGVTHFSELVVVTGQPNKHTERVGELLEANNGSGQALALNDGFHLTFLNAEDYASRFGDMANTGASRADFFGAVGLRCNSLDAIRNNTSDNSSIRVKDGEQTIAVVVEAFETLISFDL